MFVGHVLGFGGKREDVELIDGEVELSIGSFGARGVDIRIVAAQRLVEGCGGAALVHRPGGLFERLIGAKSAAGGRVVDVGEEVFGEIRLLEIREVGRSEVLQEVFRDIELTDRPNRESEVDILELVGGEVERFNVDQRQIEGKFRLCVGRSEHIVVQINVADGGHFS